jgi:hypothetical protein
MCFRHHIAKDSIEPTSNVLEFMILFATKTEDKERKQCTEGEASSRYQKG